MTRRDQKVSLAQILFADEDENQQGLSEVYNVEWSPGDAVTREHRAHRLARARAGLRLSVLLQEPIAASLSLSELCKRKLAQAGGEGAEEALRCADKAIEIAGPGWWDSVEVQLEAEDNPVPDPRYEKNATCPGLANAATLAHIPVRVAQLCLRSALLQRGNALAAAGCEAAARGAYERLLPLLEVEPRCARIDWERHSMHVNIGNTHARVGNFPQADGHFQIAEALGDALVSEEGGSEDDGRAMVLCARRARGFALERADRTDEAKMLWNSAEAVPMLIDLNSSRKVY